LFFPSLEVFAFAFVFVPVCEIHLGLLYALDVSRFGLGARWRSGSGHRHGCLREGLEAPAAAPHAVQDDGQFAGHGDDGSLLAALARLAASFSSQRRN